MKKEINPQETSRAEAFRLWMTSPMPMVTLVKTLDVSRLVKVSKRTGMKFTMLMCWCIGKAASEVEEFYTLPERLRVGEHSSGIDTVQAALDQIDRKGYAEKYRLDGRPVTKIGIAFSSEERNITDWQAVPLE